MNSTLEELEQKIDLAISKLETLRAENVELRGEVAQLKQLLHEKNRDETDRAHLIKAKLTSVLGRIEELETLSQ